MWYTGIIKGKEVFDMIGALLGDMIGAPYEFDRGAKTKDFPLFGKHSEFTDDSVMTIAVAEAMLDTLGQPDEEITSALVASMQKWGKKYPNAGYGGMFIRWLHEKNPKPYGSFGNGSAMRVSPAGWLFDDIETTRHTWLRLPLRYRTIIRKASRVQRQSPV